MTVQSDSKAPSRRALLAGALGGVGAWAASAIGRAHPAVASNGDPVLAGQDTLATFSTSIITSVGNGLNGVSQAAGGRGLHGVCQGSAGFGVSGVTADSTGVMGFSGGGLFPDPKAKTGVYGYAEHDTKSVGVFGGSPEGHGVHGRSSAGWAGYFDGRIFGNSYVELSERANPQAPPSNHARLYLRDNGSGKTQLCVRFHNGVIRVLATM